MCILYQGNMHRGNVEALGGLHLPRLRGKFVEWRKRKGGCGPRAVAVTLVDVISSCRVGGRILCALDAVELFDKQAVRAAECKKIACCPSVRVVEFLGMTEPSVGRIELGKPSDETSRRVVEGRDT